MLRLLIGFSLIWLNTECYSLEFESVDSTHFHISNEGGSVKDVEITHVYKENIPRLLFRHDIIKQRRILPSHIHLVVFVVRQRNLEELSRILHDVSEPSSPNYGRHWSGQTVANLTANPQASAAVISYLSLNGASIVSVTPNSEYITANATVAVWEKMFRAEFYAFHQTINSRIEEFVRTEQYSIPMELNPHVESVFNTIQMPHRLFGELRASVPIETFDQNNNTKKFANAGTVTPAKLKSFYNITTQGSSQSSQAVFATIQQYHSPADLKLFQADNFLYSLPVIKNIGDYSSDNVCKADPNSCAEGNLDVQYIMSTSQLSPTTYWYTDSAFTDWLIAVAASIKPPLVFSISYGAEEPSMSNSEMNAFNTQMMKLGIMGISVLAASGDDGANSRSARASTSGVKACGYTPIFPASSPYVTTVGATSGPESGLQEVVCQGDKGSAITSGGGFSAYYAMPTFQKTHISAYFVTAAAAGKSPKSGYATGRGYPDVSLLGYNYQVRIGGLTYGISGTSASAPVMAGIFSNINAARINSGRSSVGWANPALYSMNKRYLNDITSGHNLCVADGICCSQGYYATTGWDPATGLGSINYARLLSIWGVLGNVTISPSMRTTFAPSAFTVQGGVPVNPPSTTTEGIIKTLRGIDLITALIIACIASLVIIFCTCALCCVYMRLASKRKRELEGGYRRPLEIDTLRRNNSASQSQHQNSSLPSQPTRYATSRPPVPPAPNAENIDNWTTAF